LDSVTGVERVLGIGGVFFRANDPAALAAWYRDNLGIDPVPEDAGGHPWIQQEGPTVFSPFPTETEYFGRPEQQWMLNFRVRDLDAMRDQLRAAGATVDETTEAMDGIGRFGWAVDPEGNRFELWEPAD
jgi:predicted enzyme related to lactoylglutathione lyase